MKTQQWKFKAQNIPTSVHDGIPSPPFRRKRRHSEPHLQEPTNAYKSYVTHWKLPSSHTNTSNTNNNNSINHTNNIHNIANSINTNHSNTSHPNTSTTPAHKKLKNNNTTTTTTTTNTNTNTTPPREIIIPTTSPSNQAADSKGKPLPQPFVWRPSPVSPSSPSPHATPTSPHSPTDSNQQWRPETKSMFHPYKRDPHSPISSSSSTSSDDKFAGIRDRRRNSAPHISYPHSSSSSALLDYRLETIPELSFPSRLHISPPRLAPLGSLPSSFPSLKNYSTSNHNHTQPKRPFETLQVNTIPEESSVSNNAESSSVSTPPDNPDDPNDPDNIPKFARNTRRRMSVDNLLA